MVLKGKVNMKRTVIYQEIDGHKIIRGFDRPTVDPVATKEVVDSLIKETPEYQAAEAKKAEHGEAYRALIVAATNKDDTAYKAALSAMSVRQEELKPLARALEEKIIALRRENAVYFTPRLGEVIRDASEIDSLITALQGAPQGIKICLDGAEIPDNRGKVYFRKSGGKWTRTYIVRLGDPVPADAVLEADVTESQAAEIEADRISSLPEDVKLKEKEIALAAALNEAAKMRSRLEIQGDPDALQKSKDWYDAELVRIKNLYG
jgi:hypothetical protein